MREALMQKLAKRVAERAGARTIDRPNHLREVAPGEEVPGLTALQRDTLYGRIRDLGNLYYLNWLIRQETMHVCGVMECLSDDELTALLAKVERGVEARMDGVAFEEVGLVRGASNNWVA